MGYSGIIAEPDELCLHTAGWSTCSLTFPHWENTFFHIWKESNEASLGHGSRVKGQGYVMRLEDQREL